MKKFIEKAAAHLTPLRIFLVLGAIIAFAIDHITGFAATYVMATALAADQDMPEREPKIFSYKVASGAKCYAGGIAVRNSTGYVQPATTATGLVALGIFEEQADNTLGQDGDIEARVREGVFVLGNSADSDAITIADLGNACYLVDDATVAKTNGSNTRSVAGIIRYLDDLGPWVEIKNNKSLAAGLVAANNLSDVGNAATVRNQIGANLVALELNIADLVASDAKGYRIASPVAGVIYEILAVLENHIIVAADATLTGKINTTAITTGVVTVPLAATAIGNVYTALPSAAKTVVVGDVISFTVGGGNTDATATARLSILIKT